MYIHCIYVMLEINVLLLDGVHGTLHICPCVGYFTSSGRDTRQKEPTACIVSSERHIQSGMNEVALTSKQHQVDSNLLLSVDNPALRPPSDCAARS